MSKDHRMSPQATPAPEQSWLGSPLTHARRLALMFLQALFESAPVGKCKWDQDPTKTEIWIGSVLPEDVNNLTARPALVVEVGPASFLNLTIDQFEALDFTTGEVTYSDLVQSTLAIHCLSSSVEEAEWLSWVVGKHTWLLKNCLRQEGFFEVGRRVQFTAAQSLALPGTESWPIVYLKAVTLPFYFQERYTVGPPVTHRDKFDVQIQAVSTTGDDPMETRKLSLDGDTDEE